MTRRRCHARLPDPTCDPRQHEAAAIDRFGPPHADPARRSSANAGTARSVIALETAGIGSWDSSIATARCDSPDAPDSLWCRSRWGRSCRRQRRASPPLSTRRPRLRVRVRQSPGWLLRGVCRRRRRATWLVWRRASTCAMPERCTPGLTALQGLDALELRPDIPC